MQMPKPTEADKQVFQSLVPGARGSSFADEVTPSTAADPMERLAAFSGRRPVA